MRTLSCARTSVCAGPALHLTFRPRTDSAKALSFRHLAKPKASGALPVTRSPSLLKPPGRALPRLLALGHLLRGHGRNPHHVTRAVLAGVAPIVVAHDGLADVSL